jgi:flagellar motor switch protein FliN/FliY
VDSTKPQSRSDSALSRGAAGPEPTRNGKSVEIAMESKGKPLISLDSAIIKDVNVQLEAKLGGAALTIEALLALRAGSVVPLDLKLSDLVELRLNGSVVARGEIVAVDDNFGVRIVEVGEGP